MTRIILLTLIRERHLTNNQALNQLQDQGIVSDLCLDVIYISKADLQAAVKFFQ